MNNLYHHYHIAYRRSPNKRFEIIPNPPYGWCADPFLVWYCDELYIFAEIFLYKTERSGVIGYCRYDKGNWTGWQVTMDRHWHLSYPNVFVREGELYMCPECYQTGDVIIYKLENFPDKWSKVRTLASNVEYCDNTFANIDGREYMFTFRRKGNGVDGDCLLFRMDGGRLSEEYQVISSHPKGNRPAGNVIIENDKVFRVAQNNECSYGGGLVFYEIDCLVPRYEEHLIRKVDIEDINDGEWKDKYQGLHTYNRLGDFEVIDIREDVFSEEEQIAQTRVREIFVNKYRQKV